MIGLIKKYFKLMERVILEGANGSITNSFTSSKRHVKVVQEGKKVTITVNGKKVDPKSAEGKRILKTTGIIVKNVDTSMNQLGKDMTKMGTEMSKAFKNFKI